VGVFPPFSLEEVTAMAQAMPSGRRRHERYTMVGDVFIGSTPLFHTVGKLMDISRGGIGFEYTAGRNNGRPRAITLVVDILCRKHFRLSRVPCRIAYDIQVNQASFDGIQLRRCGLEFGRLSEQQAALLGLLLKG
jgi:hypothetical protein